MRVYLPATFSMLVGLRDTGAMPVRSGWGFAVTSALRELYDSGTEDEFEAIAFDDAAEASLRLLAAGGEERFGHRRVVVSVDVADAVATPAPEMIESVVKLSPATIAVDTVAAIHVDVAESEQATARAIAAIDAADMGDEDAQLAVGDAQDNYLAFYDPSELPFLVELL